MRDNDHAQKKLKRFKDELVRNLDKHSKKLVELQEMVKKFRREYEMKKEQVKSVLGSLKDIDNGKKLNV